MLFLVFLLPLSWGFHCDVDEDLDNVQEYTYTIPEDTPLEDLEYWKTFQMNYQVFGQFGADPSSTVITAGLYTPEDNLVYSITVDCGANSWKSEVVSAETLEVTEFLAGNLDTPCTGGEEFDIWLKTHQPHMMSWLFNGQALQFDLRETYFGNKMRFRPEQVPNKYRSEDANQFVVTSSDSGAAFTRYTQGKCNAWPKSLQNHCYNARKWVSTRSKLFGGYDDVVGKGHFGANMPLHAPVCYFDSQYYSFLQSYVHPDRNSRGAMYCCCVDMATAEITLKGNGEVDCDVAGAVTGGCDKSCSQNANMEFMQEAIIEYEAKLKEEEEAAEH